MDVVYVPFHDLKLCQKEGFRTRDAHIFKCLQEREDISKILVVNRPTSLIEVMLGKKKTISQGEVILKDKYCYLLKLDERTYCIDMLSFDVVGPALKKRMWIPIAYSKRRLTSFYNRCLSFLGITDPVTYTSTPLTIPFFEGKSFRYRIFDAVDNLLKYDIFARDKGLLEGFYNKGLEWNLFLCNSNDSYNFFFKEQYSNMMMIANGVDLSDFVNKEFAKPAELAQLPYPVVGYGGKMQVMFDKVLMERLSKEFPEVSFVLVGQILNEKYMSDVLPLPNVHYLGDKTYSDYKSYVSNFDVCIIPYRKETQHGGDPIKFYEYLATGNPTISTAIGEIAKYANNSDVFIVDDSDQFIAALKRIISNGVQKNTSRSLPDAITWAYKTNTIIEKVKHEGL